MPVEVLEQAQRELLDCGGHGLSILEMPFTGDEFRGILRQTRDDLRALLQIPDHFHILFMHGGASAQFSLVPLNLLGDGKKADYVETGYWSRKAIREARRYCAVNIVGSSEENQFCRMPTSAELRIDPDAAYCHITTNETANGIQFHAIPDCGDVPLVADMTSDFLSRPIDFNRFGLIYASAQKNIGPAGLTVVIVRDDLLGRAQSATPAVFNYREQAEAGSMLNTPTTFAVYLAGLVFKWVAAQGGIAAMEQKSLARSRRIYDMIDGSNGFYRCPIVPADRSRMNPCFTLADDALTSRFLADAARQGLANLKGHVMMGGIRISLYNAMPDAGVAALAAFMHEFREQFEHHV